MVARLSMVQPARPAVGSVANCELDFFRLLFESQSGWFHHIAIQKMVGLASFPETARAPGRIVSVAPVARRVIVFEATQFVCLWRNHLLWCDFFRLKLIEWEKWHLAKGEFSLGDLTFWTDTLIPDPLYLNLAWFVWLLRQARKETVSKGYLIGEAEFLAGVILVFSTPSPVVSTISKIFTLGAPSEEYKFFIKKIQGGSNQLWIRNWMWMWGGSLWGSISVWEPGFGMWGQRRGRENFG